LNRLWNASISVLSRHRRGRRRAARHRGAPAAPSSRARVHRVLIVMHDARAEEVT
jgi:hypothetical protein